MCDPITLAAGMTAVAGGQAVMQHSAGRKAADEFNRAQERAFALTRRQSTRNFELQVTNAARRGQEAQDSASQEAQAVDQRYRQVLGTVQTVQGERGVTGATARDVRSEFALRAREAIIANRHNLRSDQARIADELVAAQLSAENSNLQALPQFVAGPSKLTGVFSVLNTAFGAALSSGLVKPNPSSTGSS